MKKALLAGNGMTSHLIQEYQDGYMIEEFKKIDLDLYNSINDMLIPFRSLKNKNEKTITDLLVSMGIEYHHYLRYFLWQNLNDELGKSEITGIESLLKVARLFHHVKEFDYERIKQISNELYFNNGNNGLEAIDSDEINREKFCEFINTFDMVFTTNFDNVLDETFNNEVCHLHGGFYYNRSANIEKTKCIQSPENAYLIWGRDEYEKNKQIHGGIGGGFCNGIYCPPLYGESILEEYYKKLYKGLIDELHIWGYSGLNDGHINKAIQTNNQIRKVIYYGDPRKIDDINYFTKIRNLFTTPENSNRFRMLSWNEIWNKVMAE